MDTGTDSTRHPFRLIQGGLNGDGSPDRHRRMLRAEQARRGRPDLRRPPLTRLVTLRIHAELGDSEPPIWRALDVRSDLSLADLHRVLQAAFAWHDSHLHRFSIGGTPFDQASQLVLNAYEFEEGDDDGWLEDEVRVDEALQEPGDVLSYVYDYGDNWDLALRVADVRPADTDTPPAVAVGGERAAPPEDCGGLRDAASLAEVLPDPAQFDVDDVNRVLAAGEVSARFALPDALAQLLVPVLTLPVASELAHGLKSLPPTDSAPDREELPADLHAVQWFLDRVAGEGLPLTQAGYLKPDDASAAAQVVPEMAGWIGKNNRESLAVPLAEFRTALQKLGLLRTSRGRLLLTKAGERSRRDPLALWDHLATSLTRTRGRFEAVATPLLLATVAATGEEDLPAVAAILTAHGWRTGDAESVHPYAARDLAAVALLRNLRPRVEYVPGRSLRRGTPLSRCAVGLAREAVRRLD